MMSVSFRAQWVALIGAGQAGKLTEVFALAMTAARRENLAAWIGKPGGF